MAAQVARAELEAARNGNGNRNGMAGVSEVRTSVSSVTRNIMEERNRPTNTDMLEGALDNGAPFAAASAEENRAHRFEANVCRQSEHGDAHRVHQQQCSHGHVQGNAQVLAPAGGGGGGGGGGAPLMQGGGVAGQQPSYANGELRSGWNDGQANAHRRQQQFRMHSADLAAAAMQAQHRASVTASMSQRGPTGIGNVEYMNLASINGGGGPQEGWMGGGGAKSPEDRMHHAMLASRDPGDEDGSSNILKMMFGVAL